MNEPEDQSGSAILIGNVLPWVLFALSVMALLGLMTIAYWRSSGTGDQVQVPMFYDAHYLFPRAWTQEQAAPGVPNAAPVAFFGHNHVSQSFIAGADQLAMISIWLAGPEDSPVMVSLADNYGQIWQGELVLSSGIEGGEYSITFSPISGSAGNVYTLTLSAPQATAEHPVTTLSLGGDRLGHSLRLNEFIRPGNLAITTYSKGMPGLWWLAALGEQMLPAVFRLRLQQYKPAAFKGPLFSWLLVITAGLSIILLVLANPNREPRKGSIRRALGRYLSFIVAAFLIWQIGSGGLRSSPGEGSVPLDDVLKGEARTASTSPRPRLVTDLVNDLWTADREPEERFISTDMVQGLPAIIVPGNSRIEYTLIVPPESRLRFAQIAEGQEPLDFRVQINDSSLSDISASPHDDSTNDLRWHEVDLNPWSGQGANLSLITSSEDEEGEGLWIMPQVVTDAPWLLPDPPVDVQYQPARFTYSDSVELVGITLEPIESQGADVLNVGILWRPHHHDIESGKVFVHLLDANDRLVAQNDSVPVNGAYPFPFWRQGTAVLDEHILQLDEEPGSGPYRLAIGIYDPDSSVRWTTTGADGQEIEDGRAIFDLPPGVIP